ncbi:VOC family protein [Jatrophihabitans sp.]|uniref:VOC family protein n=1 Tax=Jatrophihabitans sp. TaxID=1932789 RepID=UPI0030C75836
MSGYFHIGLLVDELEPAMESLGAALGVTWRPIYDVPLTLTSADRAVAKIRLRLVYSAGPTPAIELIERAPGTPFADAPGGGRLHHLGKWSTDLPADVAEARGWSAGGGGALAGTVADHNGAPSCLALLSTPLGFYLELVDPQFARPGLADLIPDWT